MAEAYGKSQLPDAKIEGINFGFHHSGALYSYVTISFEADGKRFDQQLKTDDFFNWLGEQLLNKNT